VVALVGRLARQNRRWGFATSCAATGSYPRHGRGGPSWSFFLRTQVAGMLACDLFTVENVGLIGCPCCSSSSWSGAGCGWAAVIADRGME
jgi:hypothetical protein